MKILIVDDEQLARERLQDLLHEIDIQFDLLQAANGLEALKIIEGQRPDVVLLDIRMPVMDGLEVAYHLAALERSPAVVFTTAYQEHALTAFDANAVDYLLKPIRLERLLQSLQRARILNQGRITEIRKQDPQAKMRSHLSASYQGKIELIPISEIRYLKAEQKYITVGRPDKETLIDDSLKSLEDEFQHQFLRIHRNALVALNYIESLEKDSEGNYCIGLSDITERLIISRRHLSDVRRAVKQRGK